MRKRLVIIGFAGIFLFLVLATVSLKNFTDRHFSADILNAAQKSSGASSTPTLADALQQMQDQIQGLSSRMDDLDNQIRTVELRTFFTRTLKHGDSGEDVTKLQELLAKSPWASTEDNASDTVSGYYGDLTENAVKQLQTQTDLKPTGIFDLQTREKFYESVANLINEESSSSEFTSIDLSTVTGLQTLENQQNQVSTAALDEIQNNINTLQNQVAEINATINDLRSGLNAAPVNPLPQPLVISNVQAVNIGRNSATITWTTTNSASSEVDYSTNSSLSGSQSVKDATLNTNHSLTISNLNGSTNYYYRVVSIDANKTNVVSTTFSFSTTH